MTKSYKQGTNLELLYLKLSILIIIWHNKKKYWDFSVSHDSRHALTKEDNSFKPQFDWQMTSAAQEHNIKDYFLNFNLDTFQRILF